ncbi:MAG: ECF transporter S component [Clostridia bacterium]|nr:ECF transporter S component [Clostridia bacterium]
MKKRTAALISLFAIPLVIVIGNKVFNDKQYAFISAAVVILSLVQFFLSFERKENAGTKLVLIAVMTALSIAGRMIFAVIPGFKPVTAIVVVTAIYFGKESGFITGAMSALLSNFYFGQGPWTPFQMLTWGLIGWFAGVFSSQLKNSRIYLTVYALLSGIAYSLLMDVWSTLWFDGVFNVRRYLYTVFTAMPFTAIYAVSNIIFLLLITKPIGKKLERIRIKYGL